MAAETLPPNKAVNAAEVITELRIGEALLSFLDAKGVPLSVWRCFIAPPQGRIGQVTTEERAVVIAASPPSRRYDKMVDRPSVYEVLTDLL